MCPNCGNRAFSDSPPSTVSGGPKSGASQSGFNPAGGNSYQTRSQSGMPNSSGTISSYVTQFEPAGHWKRIFASVIDAVLISVISGIPVALSYGAIGARNPDAGPNLLVIVMVILSFVIPYAYYTILHGSPKRATFGKQAMGLLLVTVQGEQLTKIQAFIRILITALLPIGGIILLGLSAAGMVHQYKAELQDSIVIAILIGLMLVYIVPFALVFFNPKRQTLFDMICKTCVINRPLP
jgi:uncharacterized RDD family membrane protein YckC